MKGIRLIRLRRQDLTIDRFRISQKPISLHRLPHFNRLTQRHGHIATMGRFGWDYIFGHQVILSAENGIR